MTSANQRHSVLALLAPVLLGLAAMPSAQAQPAPTAPPAPAAATTASACPSYLRQDLAPKWMTCADGKAQVNWPPHDGFQGDPVARQLPVGELIDRFGSEGGSFFSPRGESFDSRAVPYVCTQMDYRVYRVVKPMPVEAGRAAKWFDEPGGAMQYETNEPAYKLRADGYLELVDDEPAGTGKPAPQCRRP
jgi:hypothetical protein